MILFTKEVFLQIKKLSHLHINVQDNGTYAPDGKLMKNETWQLFLQGTIADAPQHGEMFQTYITAASKEDAYRMYKELAQQVIDSGEVPDLNTKLIDAVLKGEATDA